MRIFVIVATAALSLVASSAGAEITVRDGTAAPRVVKTFEAAGVHTYAEAQVDIGGARIDPATKQLQQSILAALGSPLQAGGSVGIVGPLPGFAAAPTVNLGTLGGAATAAAQLDNVAFAGTSTPLAASATFTGVARDTGVTSGAGGLYAYFNGFFLADQTGTAFIDGSNDGTTWAMEATAAVTAATPLILTVPVMFRYHRTRFVNGTTAQGSFVANSSYTAG